MIQSVYHTSVTTDEICAQKIIIEKSNSLPDFRIKTPAENVGQVMLYPNFLEKGAIQVMGKGVINIWAKDSKDMWLIVECLNRLIGSQKVKDPINTIELGARSGYYVSKRQYLAEKAVLIKYHHENPNEKYSIMIRNSSGYGITSKLVEFDEYLKKWEQDYRY
jgi:hypothetical protein